MIRIILPFHLRTLAHVGSEVTLELTDLKPGAVTQSSVLGAGIVAEQQARYPNLRAVIPLLLVALIAVGCKSNVTPPQRPSIVPPSAVWAGGPDGGSFFECDVYLKANVNRCLLYNDYTGDVEGGGFYQLSELKRAARVDELKFSFYDGERIFLMGGEVLVPAKAIPPEGIPLDSILTNGLFISCNKPLPQGTTCSIYRPDGKLYYKGMFVLEGERGNEASSGIGYKFFDLSDRTIHLIDGGTLVSKQGGS